MMRQVSQGVQQKARQQSPAREKDRVKCLVEASGPRHLARTPRRRKQVRREKAAEKAIQSAL